MSTTKFMTATGSNRELHIKRSNEDHVQIRQFDPEFHTHQAKTFFLDPSEAPALALAILEAAGVPMQGDFSRPTEGTEAHLSFIAQHLERYVVESEFTAAEARERAELEAEALELFKASGAYGSDRLFLKFSDLEETTQSAWLAVARRAREMRAEK